jgi:hypothetical protein
MLCAIFRQGPFRHARTPFEVKSQHPNPLKCEITISNDSSVALNDGGAEVAMAHRRIGCCSLTLCFCAMLRCRQIVAGSTHHDYFSWFDVLAMNSRRRDRVIRGVARPFLFIKPS